jgi:hypothetical protein
LGGDEVDLADEGVDSLAFERSPGQEGAGDQRDDDRDRDGDSDSREQAPA